MGKNSVIFFNTSFSHLKSHDMVKLIGSSDGNQTLHECSYWCKAGKKTCFLSAYKTCGWSNLL